MNGIIKKAKPTKAARCKWKCSLSGLDMPLKVLAGILVVLTALIRLAEVIWSLLS